MVACWTVAGFVALWALVRLLGLESGYPLVPLISYTPVTCIPALVATGLSALLRQWPAAAVSGVAAVVLVLAVAPRALGGADEDAEGRHLRVMSANIFRGEGKVERLVRLARERDVDILAVQELTSKAAADLSELGIGRLLPHSQLSVQEGVRGSGIYSRYPLMSTGAGELKFKQTRAVVSVAPGLLVEVVSVHPEPPRGPRSIEEWSAGLGALPGANEDRAQLLLGDFNATLDHDALRELIDTGYADAADRTGEGLSMTWPADRSWPPEVAIDHVLLEDGWAVRDFEVLDLPGSDHRPVYAELVIPSR
jgi:endonuclease/exonuclease/phosphatase family metal-dependent hydrolase